MVTGRAALAWDVAAAVPDPELPYLTLADLGILRDTTERDGTVVVTITPTYAGCPAMTEILRDLSARLSDANLQPIEIRTALAPPWTSDWITSEGRQKLAAVGIAPPPPAPPLDGPVPVALVAKSQAVLCPQCGSPQTAELARFGATACKALYRCEACQEPFEHMRAI